MDAAAEDDLPAVFNVVDLPAVFASSPGVAVVAPAARFCAPRYFWNKSTHFILSIARRIFTRSIFSIV